MSSSKSPDALDSLEADLRRRLNEVNTLDAYRGRLEREARVDAEIASRVDAVIARRIGSMPPPASPSYHPASLNPASFQSGKSVV